MRASKNVVITGNRKKQRGETSWMTQTQGRGKRENRTEHAHYLPDEFRLATTKNSLPDVFNALAPPFLICFVRPSARRRQMVDVLTMERNRLHSSQDAYVQRDLREVVKFLAACREQLDQALREAVQRDSKFHLTYSLLTSIPGGGPVVALTTRLNLTTAGLTAPHSRSSPAPAAAQASHPGG